MLKNIPKCLSPELVHALMSMGHGDEIVIADANFPSETNAKRLIRCDGIGIEELLESILYLFPLDHSSEYTVGLMEVSPGDSYDPVIWKSYDKILQKSKDPNVKYKHYSREDFYKKSRECYAIVASGEMSLYANIILKKGVVTEV